MRRLALILLTASALLLMVSHRVSAQVRDFAPTGKNDPTGTASISGMTVTDDEQPRPLRRVVVTITEAATIIQPRVVTSDESGKFRFRNLPAGRYTISADRAPYLTGVYGARRIAGPGHLQTGTVIVVSNGQEVADVAIKLLRSSVITGTLRDADGEPARGFYVTAMYYSRSPSTGEKTLVNAASYRTDDRGAYRIYGLKPGSYLINVTGASTGGTLAAVQTTNADISRAMALLSGTASAAVSGTQVPASAAPASATPIQERRVGYASVFYPGTTDVTQASPITVTVGEERSGVDFQMELVSTARIRGKVATPAGALKGEVTVRITRPGLAVPSGPIPTSSVGVTEQGEYEISGLSPGPYTLIARGSAADKSGTWYGVAEISIAGGDRNLDIMMQPAQPFSGRLVFDATTLKPPAATAVRATLFSTGPGATAGIPVSASGEFTISGVMPGMYQLLGSQALPSIETGWYLKSSTVYGQETLDRPFEIRPGEAVTDAVITLTDRPSEVFGTMTDANSSPAPEYYVIIFSADEAHWSTGSRRIMQTRPSNDGSFSFKNLPPGDYRIAAVIDVQAGEWFDPAFLAQLVGASVQVKVTEHGKIRQDLRIR